MTFDEYQKLALKTDVTPPKVLNANDSGFIDKVLGISGESGEFADKIKKILRDENGVIDETQRRELSLELGDVLWYLAVLAKYLDVPFEQVAKSNIEKLTKRYAENKISGSGDNR